MFVTTYSFEDPIFFLLKTLQFTVWVGLMVSYFDRIRWLIHIRPAVSVASYTALLRQNSLN